jgi:hypothetical protein
MPRIGADYSWLTRMRARSVLLAVRDLFRDRGKWTFGALATDSIGEQTPVRSPRAVKWCALGAIELASYESLAYESLGGIYSTDRARARECATEMLHEVLRLHDTPLAGDEPIPHVNDGPNGYERIMEALNRVVEPPRPTSPVAPDAPSEPEMTFGGTLPTTTTSADAIKEEVSVS